MFKPITEKKTLDWKILQTIRGSSSRKYKSNSTAGDGTFHMEFGRLKRRKTTSLLNKVSEILYFVLTDKEYA